MIITIGGLAGSGTTTSANVLSEKLNIPFLSTGSVFREMAKEYDMSLLEFSSFAEDNTEIDKEIDKRQVKIAEESENLIVEGRLSAHFIDADLKIWMYAPFETRVKRICEREDKTFDTAKYEIEKREESEAQRYLDIYDININNYEIYDLMLNTDKFSPEDLANIIIKTLKVI